MSTLDARGFHAHTAHPGGVCSYRDDLFKTNTRSARNKPHIDRTRNEGLNLETGRSRATARGPQTSHRSSSGALRTAGAGISSPSARGQQPTGRTAARLESLERMIMQESQQRRQLQGELEVSPAACGCCVV